MKVVCPPKNEAARKTMLANRSKNTKPELQVRKLLWKAGLRGYRLHNKELPGTPDISFPTKRIAIFVHGCFWHGHTKCKQYTPKHNKTYWAEKLNRNKEKDVNHIKALKRLKWTVIVIWECEKNNQFTSSIKKITEVYSKSSKSN